MLANLSYNIYNALYEILLFLLPASYAMEGGSSEISLDSEL